MSASATPRHRRCSRAGRATGSLREAPVFGAGACVCVVLAARGYPGVPAVGDVIDGVDDAAMLDGVEIYAAGVGRDTRDRLVTAGGRVLGVTAVAATLALARTRVYEAVGMIDWLGITFRRDIAERASTSVDWLSTTVERPDRGLGDRGPALRQGGPA